MTPERKNEICLGDTARDSITKYTGIVVAVTNWLNGCRRITIQSQALKDGVPVDNHTFDVQQVELIQSAEPAHHSAVGGPSIRPTRNPDPV